MPKKYAACKDQDSNNSDVRNNLNKLKAEIKLRYKVNERNKLIVFTRDFISEPMLVN